VKTLAFEYAPPSGASAKPGVHSIEAAHQAIAAVLTDADGKVYRGRVEDVCRGGIRPGEEGDPRPRPLRPADGASLGAFTVRLYAWAATEFGRIDYTYETITRRPSDRATVARDRSGRRRGSGQSGVLTEGGEVLLIRAPGSAAGGLRVGQEPAEAGKASRRGRPGRRTTFVVRTSGSSGRPRST